jgi:hypothetical protein
MFVGKRELGLWNFGRKNVRIMEIYLGRWYTIE